MALPTSWNWGCTHVAEQSKCLDPNLNYVDWVHFSLDHSALHACFCNCGNALCSFWLKQLKRMMWELNSLQVLSRVFFVVFNFSASPRYQLSKVYVKCRTPDLALAPWVTIVNWDFHVRNLGLYYMMSFCLFVLQQDLGAPVMDYASVLYKPRKRVCTAASHC